MEQGVMVCLAAWLAASLKHFKTSGWVIQGRAGMPQVSITSLCSGEVLKYLTLLDPMTLLPLVSLHTGPDATWPTTFTVAFSCYFLLPCGSCFSPLLPSMQQLLFEPFIAAWLAIRQSRANYIMAGVCPIFPRVSFLESRECYLQGLYFISVVFAGESLFWLI